MPFLHIEHPITDLKSWVSAFAGFTETRRQAGVTAETVRRPEGDDAFVVIDLEFDTTEQAHTFLHFLETQIWVVAENAPALAGSPEARILTTVEFTGPDWEPPS